MTAVEYPIRRRDPSSLPRASGCCQGRASPMADGGCRNPIPTSDPEIRTRISDWVSDSDVRHPASDLGLRHRPRPSAPASFPGHAAAPAPAAAAAAAAVSGADAEDRHPIPIRTSGIGYPIHRRRLAPSACNLRCRPAGGTPWQHGSETHDPAWQTARCLARGHIGEDWRIKVPHRPRLPGAGHGRRRDPAFLPTGGRRAWAQGPVSPHRLLSHVNGKATAAQRRLRRWPSTSLPLVIAASPRRSRTASSSAASFA